MPALLKILAVAQSKPLKTAPQYPTWPRPACPATSSSHGSASSRRRAPPPADHRQLVAYTCARSRTVRTSKHISGQGGLEPLKENHAQFGARMRSEYKRFRDIVKAAKLEPE